MRKGKLTREMAIQEAGRVVVEKLDYENCEHSGRVQTDGDPSVEFTASLHYRDAEGDRRTLIAYYYQMQEDIDKVDELDQLDWEIEGYEVQ